MTFVLISTVYACGVNKPGHGSLTPLAVGLSLVACAGVGERSPQPWQALTNCCSPRCRAPSLNVCLGGMGLCNVLRHVSWCLPWRAGGFQTGAALNPARVIGPLAGEWGCRKHAPLLQCAQAARGMRPGRYSSQLIGSDCPVAACSVPLRN